MMINDDTLQRLVDGELSGAEYQEALLALEDDPSTCESNAWRRCALGFLESQAFELGAKSWIEARHRGDDPSELATENAALVENARPRRAMPLWMTLTAMAASLAGAFWVGGVMNDFTHPKIDIARAPVRSTQPEIEQISNDGPIFVSFSVPEDEEGVFDAEAWRAGQPTPLSPEVERQWQRRGYTLRASRRIIRKTILQDGREIGVPFEQYEMVPTAPAPQ